MGSGGPEDVIESTVCNMAEKAGWLVRKVRWIGVVGAMDHVFAKGGRVVFIEFKASRKQPNVIQSREIARWRAAGVEVYWIDSIAEGLRILRVDPPGRLPVDFLTRPRG